METATSPKPNPVDREAADREEVSLMLRLKSKTDGLYVVVQTQPGFEPAATKPWDLDAAMRIFEGVVTMARSYGPHEAPRLKVVRHDDWLKSQTVRYALEAE